VTSGSARSLARIDRHDLLYLAEFAAEVEAGLFARRLQGAGCYAGRLLCRALCQGAALHYLNATNGVKDFDVWSFYLDFRGYAAGPSQASLTAWISAGVGSLG
jgi:hypothetical protein